MYVLNVVGKFHFLLPYETITEAKITPKAKLIFLCGVEGGEFWDLY